LRQGPAPLRDTRPPAALERRQSAAGQRAEEGRPGCAGAARAIWGLGAMSGPPVSIRRSARDEGRPGFAGAARTMGVWGPCLGPQFQSDGLGAMSGPPVSDSQRADDVAAQADAEARALRRGDGAVDQLEGLLEQVVQQGILAARE